MNVPVESHQYSDGRSMVVALRSASVITQSLVPLDRAFVFAPVVLAKWNGLSSPPRGLLRKIGLGIMTETYAAPHPVARAPLGTPTLYRNTPPAETFGRRRHPAKCFRISVALSCIPQRQPHGILGPGGRPPRFGLGGSCHIPSRALGRCGQSVKCRRIWLVETLAPQPHPHCIRGPGDRPTRLMAIGSSSEIFTRTRFLHLWQVPDTHRTQKGRPRCLNWRSAPQHMQTRSSGVGSFR